MADSDVASFLFNRDPIRSPRYAPHFAGQTLVLPFVVVSEMLFGARTRNWGPSRRWELEKFIRSHPIEYPGYVTCEVWADVRATTRRAGRPIERQDAWVAATALYLDVPLVTHNADHFLHVPGLQVITSPDASP